MKHHNRPLNRDKLSMLSRETALEAAFEALHPVQGLDPEPMVAGVAILFAAITSRCGLDPEGLYAMGSKMLRDQPGHLKANGALQSLRDFAGIRVAGEQGVSVS